MIKARKLDLGGGTDYLADRGPKRKNVYERFCEWFVLPTDDKKKMGIPYQKDFADKYGISENTLSLWANSQKFQEDADRTQIRMLNAEGGDAWQGVMKRIKKYGFGYEMELYLAYVKGWDRKKVIEFANEIKLTDEDIRTVVEYLPEHKRKQFYDTIATLIAEAEEAKELATV